MSIVILGYYSSINLGNLCMLKGLLYLYPSEKIYIPVFYPYLEKLLLEKEKLTGNVQPIYFLSLFKLFHLVSKSKKILYLFGDSLTGIYGFFSQIFVMLNLLLILFAGKKSVILPSTILPSKFKLSFLRLFLGRVSKIYVRERKFLKIIRRKINKKAFFGYDLSVFYLKNIARRLRHLKKQNIIVFVLRNISPELINFNRETFIKIISNQIEIFLQSNKKYKVILLPFQFGLRSKNDDKILLREILNNISKGYHKKLILIERLLPLINILKIIKRSKLLVSTRLHACIIASAFKTFFIALEESFRIVNFAKENGGLIVKRNELTNLSKYLELALKRQKKGILN